MAKSKLSKHRAVSDGLEASVPRNQNESMPIDSPDPDLSESSDSSDEDEDGDLVTENIDHGINEVLAAIRSNSEKLKDSSVRFFPDIGADGTAEAEGRVKREKPVYLKDYQREQVLSGAEANQDDNTPETYSEEQARIKSDLVRQFHDDDDDNKDEANDDEDESGLLKKRSTQREIPEPEGVLPDPEQDADAFLNAFISKKAWVPTKKDSVPTYDQVVDDDEEDSEEFDDLSEKFESAYNFRYEDPNAAEIVSYARDQNTLRRGKLSSRQKKREKIREEREKSKEQQKLEMAKLRKLKVNEVTDRMAQLQEALGDGEDRVAELLSKEDLDGDFDVDEWDKRMQKLFNEEYYGRDDDSLKPSEALNNEEDLGEEVEVAEEAPSHAHTHEQDDGGLVAEKKMSRKDLKRKAEQFVDENQDLLVEETTKPQQVFKYRQVDPESFGLTSRDILLASDKDLNRFAGLKKLASYRDRSKSEADRRKYSKRKRLRQWRKEVFGTEDSPTDELWEKAKQEEAKQAKAAQAVQQQPKHKSKKRKHHH